MARGPRVFEARDIARGIRETFADRPVEFEQRMNFAWPSVMQHVGDSLAIAYASDKWQRRGADGKRFEELYKHIAESHNRVLVIPGLLHDFYNQDDEWPSIGPYVPLDDVPMPRHFAILGLFREADLRLHTGGTDRNPRFGPGEDDGVVKSIIGHAKLGASKIQWSKTKRDVDDEPFLFVYTETSGMLMMFRGDELDIEKDGIVG